MRWAFRIVSGLILMTAPYVWTVGQAGLETANKNICELANSFSSLPTCKIHYYYSGLWIAGLIAAAGFIVVDGMRFINGAATPHGGIVVFYRHYQGRAVFRVQQLRSRMEPSHIIILGLVIAAIGVAWQVMRKVPAVVSQADSDKTVISLRQQLESAKRTVASYEAIQRSRSSADALLSLAKAGLPETDAERQLRAMADLGGAPEREFTKKTVRELRAFYEGRTRLQADAFMSDEKGKLIEPEGKIVNVDSGMVMLQTSETAHDGMFDFVECRFAPEWNAKLATYRQGEHMKVRGTIGPSQNGAQIYLEKCQIVDQIITSATAPVAAPPTRYTAYEKEQRLRAVDEIYSAVATQLRSIYTEGNSLIDGIYRGQIDDGAEGRLTDYRNSLQTAFNNLNGILKKYNYFPDIVQVPRKNTFNDVEATHGVGNLVTEIQQFRQIAPNQLQWFLLRSSTMELSRNQMRRFDQYLSDATMGLQEKRTEIEAAQVYAGDNK